ncbi:sensor histidine kinase [Actinokineospora sp.]|uniref:sensor histidine kinase n=1 Tax=Actinokineospora sp. TaxID=1872133 RepID=UPI00403820D6
MDSQATARRWLAGLLALAYLFDLLVFGLGGGDVLAAALPLPLIACVFLALRLPVVGALAGVAAVLGTSALLRGVGAVDRGFPGIDYLMLTEGLAGAALVVIVVWRCGRWVAAGCATALVLAAVGSMAIRAPRLGTMVDRGLVYTLLTGLVVVSGAVALGVLLRMSSEQRLDQPTREFLRGQWPLGAALTFLFFIDLVAAVDYFQFRDARALFALVPVVAALATAGCAFLGPRAAVRWTITAAVVAAVAALTLAPLGLVMGTFSVFPAPLTMAAAHMALVAYVVRYADRQQAAISVGALVGADLLAVAMTAFVGGRPSELREFLLIAAFLLLLSLAAGQYFRARDRERTQTVHVAVTGAQQAERMALARELHDVVAHHVTGIVVQAQAASLVATANPTAAVVALGKIERSGTEALAAMRMLVGSMRGAAPAGSSAAARQATTDLAADLRALADDFTGPTVHMELDLPSTLPPEAGGSVLRLVQESLTNVGKHAANARTVRVDIKTTVDELHVRVTDDAETAAVRPTGGSGGYGLVGMRERVDLLGGRFAAGPGETAGWTVDARIPLRKDEP